jgi:hypothetical protein
MLLLYACFLLSGVAALIYQTAWTRQFAIVFGTSELAVATVLAAYMGGLALGAWLAERYLPRIARPVLTYALLEIGIAASALFAVPFLLNLADAGLATWFKCEQFQRVGAFKFRGAYNRIEAARAARRFPGALDRLAEGLLNLGTLRLIAPHLRPENQEELFDLAAGRSKREVQEALAEIFPRPDAPPSIRRLPRVAQRRTGRGEQPAEWAAQPPGSTSQREGLAEKQLAGLAEKPETASPSPGPVAALGPVYEYLNRLSHPSGEPPRSVESATGSSSSERDQWTTSSTPRGKVVTPLSTDRYQFRFTGSAATREKFRKAQDLLRHAVPNGDPAEVFDRALPALLADLERRKFAATDRPRRGRSRAPGSRTVPAAVRRAVTKRDGGRCAFAASGGVRCGATAFLEFHHVLPYARGGPATEANIQLRCRAHNGYEAELDFGRRELVPGQVGPLVGQVGQGGVSTGSSSLRGRLTQGKIDRSPDVLAGRAVEGHG